MGANMTLWDREQELYWESNRLLEEEQRRREEQRFLDEQRRCREEQRSLDQREPRGRRGGGR